jgi:hypothetical protein
VSVKSPVERFGDRDVLYRMREGEDGEFKDSRTLEGLRYAVG